MATVFDDDFESGGLTNWTSTLVEAGNTLLVQTPSVKDGTYGLLADGGGTNDDCHANKTITGIAEIWAVYWLKLDTNVPSGSALTMLAFNVGAANQGLFALRTNTGDG